MLSTREQWTYFSFLLLLEFGKFVTLFWYVLRFYMFVLPLRSRVVIKTNIKQRWNNTGRGKHLDKLRLKCDGTCAETRFRLSAQRTSPFKSAGVSFQSIAGSRGVRISDSNAGYTMFRGSVKGTGYLLHSPVSPSLPFPCVTVCHHISTGLYSE